jgi:hypothetical protein
MQEIEIEDHRYRTGRLNAFQQFHLFRKLMPILSGMGATFADLPTQQSAEQMETDTAFWGALGPAAAAIAEMSQEDSEYILQTCLKVCSVWNGQSWVRITTPSGELMFEDINMMVMLRLTFAVMQDNLQSFFSAPLPSGSVAGETAQVLAYPSSQ